jgi:outer membrane protein OmpA-like peptidoglycan-associated protein
MKPDEPGCKDSPYVSRFPGSRLSSCSDKADDVLTVVVTEKGANHNKDIEGKISKLSFQYPNTASKPQVVRNYVTAMKAAGYQNMYDSGTYGDSTWKKGPLWIYIQIGGGGGIDIQSVQEVTLTQDVVATAAELGTGISGTGHAVVPGILFDAGKADIKPESSKALDEVAKMLTENPTWKLYVVGHTDNVGGLAANMDLSKRRAEAVAQALVTQYRVAAARLGSFGNGPYAPVASNDAEDGRALNRRVEIVKQ